MQYIIFGGSGFIGKHLIDFIVETQSEAAIYNLDIVENKHSEKAQYIFCDVRHPIENLPFQPTNNDVIINLAAIHRTPGHPAYAYFETNILGAENITKFAELNNIRKIIFTSSIAPYGASEELKKEETLPTPNTPYGISKLVAEKIHEKWQARNTNRRLVIMRPGVVFGYMENGNFIRLYNALRKRKFFYPGRKDTIKACIYVKDLVRFMINRIENGSGTELYNCTYEPAPNINQIVDSMLKSIKLQRRVLLIPSWILMLAAHIAAVIGSPLGICPDRVRKLMISTNICGKRMAATDFKMKYSFEEAITDWLKDSGGQRLK